MTTVLQGDETMTLLFGKYKGLPVDRAPRSYLRWLHDEAVCSAELRKEVERVLMTPDAPNLLVDAEANDGAHALLRQCQERKRREFFKMIDAALEEHE